MIKSIKHKGLKAYWQTGSIKGLDAKMINKLDLMLDALHAAPEASAVDFPGWRFHQLKGVRAGTYSLTVTGNWRLTFSFENGDAINLNLEDYH